MNANKHEPKVWITIDKAKMIAEHLRSLQKYLLRHDFAMKAQYSELCAEWLEDAIGQVEKKK